LCGKDRKPSRAHKSWIEHNVVDKILYPNSVQISLEKKK
jgi:hypothetical protein